MWLVIDDGGLKIEDYRLKMEDGTQGRGGAWRGTRRREGDEGARGRDGAKVMKGTRECQDAKARGGARA